MVHRDDQRLVPFRAEGGGHIQEMRGTLHHRAVRRAACPGRRRAAAPPTSSWNLSIAWAEFQPGAQKRGTRAGGGCSSDPSMEKASGDCGRRAASARRRSRRRAWRCGRCSGAGCRGIFMPEHAEVRRRSGAPGREPACGKVAARGRRCTSSTAPDATSATPRRGVVAQRQP